MSQPYIDRTTTKGYSIQSHGGRLHPIIRKVALLKTQTIDQEAHKSIMSHNDNNDNHNGEDLYDEFGNYIGPDLGDDDSSSSDEEEEDHSSSSAASREEESSAAMMMMMQGHREEDDRSDADPHHRIMVVHDSVEPITTTTDASSSMIVLHEDKEHYPSAEQVYGEGVRAVLLDEDAMDLDTPILEPVGVKVMHKSEDALDYVYSDDYLGVQFSNETGRTRRGIALVGHLHHGKTTFMDMLIEPTILPKMETSNQNQTVSSTARSTGGHWGPKASWNADSGGGPRYLDTTQAEQARQMSLVSTPITALLPDTRGKSYCVTILDCPGHPQFHDETVAALKIVDGAVVVVDVVEGMQMHTEMSIRQIIADGIPMTVLFAKMDRLMVELKLPPNDAYFKLLHVLDTINELVETVSRGRYPQLDPGRGNVAFSSGQHGWIFTLPSFAKLYLDHNQNKDTLGENLSVDEFAQRMWGDCFLDPNSRQFKKSARECRSVDGRPIQRTFVHFVLEALYKIYAACLGEREADINHVLRSVGVLLSKDQLRSSARPLLRTAMSKFLQPCHGGFVEMIVRNVPHPCAAAAGKLARCYTGPLTNSDHSAVIKSMKECDPRGPLVIHCVKNYSSADGRTFWTFGRIYSGTIRPAEPVKVLGEGYSPQDNEDVAVATIEAVAIPRGRGQTMVNMAKAGNWVLLQGVDASIAKTATIVSNSMSDEQMSEMHIFAPLKFAQAGGESIMKLAIEPLNPADLPKMVEGLRRVSKAYPMSSTKVEESGEHVVLGTGELYMDCLMHDLRQVYSDIEVKVADPIVSFRETVIETSTVKCFAETANKRNKLTFIAEPMDDGLAEQLEAGKVNLNWEKKKLGRYFQTKYHWDLLSSRSVWAFGDSPTHGTNLLLDDTLPSEVDKSLLNSCKSSIVQGFQWATREGPLCEEPVRATKIKILDATLADISIYRGGGQIIPTARRTVHSSLLTATPRLMEPIYVLDIQCPGPIVEAIQPILSRRRGHIVQDRPISGTTLFSVRGFIPVLDSFGFETDLRLYTQGQAMVFSIFDHWSIVPGDPLDRSIVLHPLEPSPQHHLARELLIKTRRRKGLSEDVSVSRYFGEDMKTYLEQPPLQDVGMAILQ